MIIRNSKLHPLGSYTRWDYIYRLALNLYRPFIRPFIVDITSFEWNEFPERIHVFFGQSVQVKSHRAVPQGTWSECSLGSNVREISKVTQNKRLTSLLQDHG